MKKTVTFRIENQDDEEEFKHILKASQYYAALWNIRQELFRPIRKWNSPTNNARAAELIEKLGQEAIELVEALEEQFNEIIAGLDTDV